MKGTVIEGRMTRAEMVERLAAEIERRASPREGETAADVRRFALAMAEKLVDEAISKSDGKRVEFSVAPRPSN